jgi:hypothetical protein
MPWSRRRTRLNEALLQREVDGLKTTICCLRRELENKQGAVGRLETLLHERLTKIDHLVAQVDQLRHRKKALGLEKEILVEMIAAPPVDAAMLVPK